MAVWTGSFNEGESCSYENLVENTPNSEYTMDAKEAGFQQANSGWFWGFQLINGEYINETITFNIDNLEHGFFGAGWYNVPVYRYNDGSDWVRHSGASFAGNKLTFTITFPDAGTVVEVFPNPPFHYSEQETWIGGLSGQLETRILGTIDGDNLQYIRINEGGLAHGKPNIWIIAGEHPGEVWTSWAARGLVDYLLSAGGEARQMRKKYCWHIIVNANPDGLSDGRGYYNTDGTNLFSDWVAKSTTNVTLLDALIVANKTPDLWLSLHCALTAAAYNKCHITGPNDGNIGIGPYWNSRRLVDLMVNHTKMTDYTNITRSNDTTTSNYMTNTKGSPVGLVLEWDIMDSTYTPEMMQAEGRGIAMAINDYFAGKAHSLTGMIQGN